MTKQNAPAGPNLMLIINGDEVSTGQKITDSKLLFLKMCFKLITIINSCTKLLKVWVDSSLYMDPHKIMYKYKNNTKSVCIKTPYYITVFVSLLCMRAYFTLAIVHVSASCSRRQYSYLNNAFNKFQAQEFSFKKIRDWFQNHRLVQINKSML